MGLIIEILFNLLSAGSGFALAWAWLKHFPRVDDCEDMGDNAFAIEYAERDPETGKVTITRNPYSEWPEWLNEYNPVNRHDS